MDAKKRDFQKVRLFGNLFRFIDSLCTINDHLEFDQNYDQKYESFRVRA